MVLEEAEMPKYVTNAHEEREVAVATTPSTRDRTVISDDFKDYLPSEAEGCNKKRVSKLRSEAMRSCYDMQPTKQSQPQDMEWQLSWSHWRAVIIGTGRGVNDDSLDTCGGPKKYKDSNGGVIDGTNANERILGADKKVLAGSEIPGVSLGYDGIREVKVAVGYKISGVNPGYDKSQRVKMKNAAVKLIELESENDYYNVGESTGVDMHAHEMAWREMVLPMDQKVGGFRIKCKIADFGQHGRGTIKLTAGEAEYAYEAAAHGWIPWQNSTVDGMMVRGLLKHENGCMRESS